MNVRSFVATDGGLVQYLVLALFTGGAAFLSIFSGVLFKGRARLKAIDAALGESSAVHPCRQVSDY